MRRGREKLYGRSWKERRWSSVQGRAGNSKRDFLACVRRTRNDSVRRSAARWNVPLGKMAAGDQEARDQPTRVRAKIRKRETKLAALRTLPFPRSAMRDSLLEQSRTMTRVIAAQARPDGRPG